MYEYYFIQDVKYHVVRREFIKYMTVCVDENGQTSDCVRKLQKTGVLGKSHFVSKETVKRLSG